MRVVTRLWHPSRDAWEQEGRKREKLFLPQQDPPTNSTSLVHRTRDVPASTHARTDTAARARTSSAREMRDVDAPAGGGEAAFVSRSGRRLFAATISRPPRTLMRSIFESEGEGDIGQMTEEEEEEGERYGGA